MPTLAHAVAFALLAVPAAGLMSRPALTDKDREKEAARFAGGWAIRSLESDGQTLDDPVIRDWVRLDIRGDRIEFLFSNLVASRDEKGTFSVVEAGRGHLKVDVSVVEKSSTDFGTPPDRKFVRKELWRLTDAKTFQRCFADDPFGERPKTFSPKKGDGTCLMTFEARKK